jgi:hypothetical protein
LIFRFSSYLFVMSDDDSVPGSSEGYEEELDYFSVDPDSLFFTAEAAINRLRIMSRYPSDHGLERQVHALTGQELSSLSCVYHIVTTAGVGAVLDTLSNHPLSADAGLCRPFFEAVPIDQWDAVLPTSLQQLPALEITAAQGLPLAGVAARCPQASLLTRALLKPIGVVPQLDAFTTMLREEAAGILRTSAAAAGDAPGGVALGATGAAVLATAAGSTPSQDGVDECLRRRRVSLSAPSIGEHQDSETTFEATSRASEDEPIPYFSSKVLSRWTVHIFTMARYFEDFNFSSSCRPLIPWGEWARHSGAVFAGAALLCRSASSEERIISVAGAAMS